MARKPKSRQGDSNSLSDREGWPQSGSCWKFIPALITTKPLDDLSQMVVSFGENIHRRKLPYNDTIKVCSKLFKEYEGSPVQKINQIGKDLGLTKQTVTRYLAYQLVPTEVRQMVEEDKVTAKKAYDITSAYWPDKDRIIAIASLVDNLTAAEFDRAINIAKTDSKASLEEVVKEAKSRQLLLLSSSQCQSK